MITPTLLRARSLDEHYAQRKRDLVSSEKNRIRLGPSGVLAGLDCAFDLRFAYEHWYRGAPADKVSWFCLILHDTTHLHSDRHLHLEGWAPAVAFERPVSC